MSAATRIVPDNRHALEVQQEPYPEEIAHSLTPAQRTALYQRQEQFFEGKATVTGHGMTMRALRSRGIVRGAMPYAYLTEFGREVIAHANIEASE